MAKSKGKGKGKAGGRSSSRNADGIQSFSRPKIKVVREAAGGVVYVDYKDTESLRKFITANGKMLGRKRTGASSEEQRMISAAIKRARFMSLLPYVAVTV